MIHFSAADYIIFILYFGILLFISIRYRAGNYRQMFAETQKTNWFLLAASLLMIEYNPVMDMMGMGIVIENGYSGIWIIKDKFWLAGVPAIIFAPMWAKLQFTTDNELIKLRYSGKSAIYLHISRAVYLSVLVIPFLASFLFIALEKMISFSEIKSTYTWPILTIVAIGLVLKNSFHQKLRTDLLNAILYLVAPVFVVIFIFIEYGGPAAFFNELYLANPEKLNLIPGTQDLDNNQLGNFMVFMLVQWWSVYIIDNSDPNAQRHLLAKSRFHAFKALFFPILLSSFMFFFVSVIWDCGLLEHTRGLNNNHDPEGNFLWVATKYLPHGFKALFYLALIFGIVTTLESLINWGGALVTHDLIKSYSKDNISDARLRIIGFGAMFSVIAISLVLSYYNDRLIDLQKFVFSISAGVAPVLVLRWFWWRINAWTQISAMLSSLVYTLIFDYSYENISFFHEWVITSADVFVLSYYPFKLVILTTIVVATWLLVMILTQPDNYLQLAKYSGDTGLEEFYPPPISHEKSKAPARFHLGRKLLLCILFAITYILPYFFIWEFKFGSTSLAFLLTGIFVLLLIAIYRSMKKILS